MKSKRTGRRITCLINALFMHIDIEKATYSIRKCKHNLEWTEDGVLSPSKLLAGDIWIRRLIDG